MKVEKEFTVIDVLRELNRIRVQLEEMREEFRKTKMGIERVEVYFKNADVIIHAKDECRESWV